MAIFTLTKKGQANVRRAARPAKPNSFPGGWDWNATYSEIEDELLFQYDTREFVWIEHPVKYPDFDFAIIEIKGLKDLQGHNLYYQPLKGDYKVEQPK